MDWRRGILKVCKFIEVCYQWTGGDVSSQCVGLEVCYQCSCGEGYPHSV